MTGLTIPHFGLKRQSKQLRDELLDVTDQVLQSGQFLDGNYTRQFENWLRLKTDSKFAITVHSGTQALEIIARYILIKSKLFGNFEPGVILPNITYPATLNAFIGQEYQAEIWDTDKFGILAPEHDDKIGYMYCLVGLYGRKPWHDVEILDSPNFIVDGAQHWLVADGDIGTGMSISFDPTKNLPSTGNGGAIVTNDVHLYQYAVKMRNNGKPEFDFAGSNTKMSEQDCAQILVRTKYLDNWQARREQIKQYYCDTLREYVTCLSDSDVPHANQKFVIYAPEHRNSLHTHLLTSGIESKIHYDYTLQDLETARAIKVKPSPLSISYMLMKGVVSLPIYPELTDDEVEYITAKVIEFYDK